MFQAVLTPAAPFVLLNPHIGDWVAEPLSFRLMRRRPLRKYGYIFSESKQRGMRVQVLICGTLSALLHQKLFNLLPRGLRIWWLRQEMKIWQKMNKLNHVDLYFSPDALPQKDTLVGFTWKTAEGSAAPARIELLSQFKNVILNLSHYYVNTGEKARNLSSLTNLRLWSESDISQNAYFKKFFGWYQQPIAVVPFCVADRFQPPTDGTPRANKCVATGSFHFLPEEKPAKYYEDFMRFWGATNYHYLRNELYQCRDDMDVKQHVTVHSAPYREGKKSFGWIKKFFDAGQKKYFAVDIVREYQTHQFAAVGEERTGNPGIGIFEAMACGALPVIYSPCYRGIFGAGDDFALTYDSTVPSLLSAIQKPAPANSAEKAMKFIKDNCRAPAVFDKFISIIQITSHG